MRTYVMQVLTGREQATIDALERMLGDARRYELFAPRFRFQKKIRGSWQDVDELLTPGYVYVRTSMLDVDELSREIRQAPPRAAMLMQDGKIIPLSSDEERWLERLTGGRQVVEPSIGVVEGDRVVITDGPLVGLESQIKKIDRHKRLAYVDVHLLGRTKTIKVGVEIVQRTARVTGEHGA